MKSVLKKYPWMMNSALSLHQVTSRAIQRKKIDKYVDMEMPARDEAPIDDAATALFLRAIMVGGHKSIIEIGSYDGARIITLKKLLPDIDARGVDILKNYAAPFERGGVAFSRFEDSAFGEGLDAPLVLSRGTLSYFDPQEVAHFFDILKEGRISIAFYEPNPFYHVEAHTIRYRKMNRVAHYHPYDDMLEARGFTLHADKKGTYNWARSLYGLECLRFQYATI